MYITPFVRIGFKNYSAKQHGFGNALSYLKLNAMNEDLEVDPAKALISWGNLPQSISPAVSNRTPRKLQITREAVPGDKDWAMVLAYDGKGTAIGEVCGPRRSEGKLVLACKVAEGMEMHVYLSFVSQERDRFFDQCVFGDSQVKVNLTYTRSNICSLILTVGFII